jgi:hypothetical protein
MNESYSEVLARHAGPESYAGGGNVTGVAMAGAHAGPVLSSVNHFIPCADVVLVTEGNIDFAFDGKHEPSMAESKTWCMYGNSKRENREIPFGSLAATSRTAHKPHRGHGRHAR